MDTSFGSGGLPENLLNATEENFDPIPMGDEVSQAYSSNNNVSTYDQPISYNPADESNMFTSNPVPMMNSNRQTGQLPSNSN